MIKNINSPQSGPQSLLNPQPQTNLSKADYKILKNFFTKNG